MDLALSFEELLAALAAYNQAIGPMRWVAYGLGAMALAMLVWRPRFAVRTLAGILALNWACAGIGFTIFYFGPVFTPAFALGALLVIEAILFLSEVARPALRFRPRQDGITWVGLLLVAYALVGFPLVGMVAGHRYPESISFGLTPCPVTVFTLGLLLMADEPVPRRLLVVPLLWVLGSVVPVGLGFLGLLALILLYWEGAGGRRRCCPSWAAARN